MYRISNICIIFTPTLVPTCQLFIIRDWARKILRNPIGYTDYMYRISIIYVRCMSSILPTSRPSLMIAWARKILRARKTIRSIMCIAYRLYVSHIDYMYYMYSDCLFQHFAWTCSPFGRVKFYRRAKYIPIISLICIAYRLYVSHLEYMYGGNPPKHPILQRYAFEGAIFTDSGKLYRLHRSHIDYL